tara:strand:- start:338 stop:1264 length:927 start_codon:yes stop_codon:yes gene_type:complete
MNPFSQQTSADDGRLCRSQFEVDVINKLFVPNNLTYEYEKRYDNSRQKCDFYLSDFDIYIECVYHDVEMIYEYQKLEKGAKIYLHIPYRDKEKYKHFYGALWDGKKRMWYIQNDKKSKCSTHDKFVDKSLLKASLMSDGKAITDNYDDHLRRKIINNNSNIILLTKKDLDKYDSLGDILLSKNNPHIHKRVYDMFVRFKAKSVSVIRGKKMTLIEDLNMQIKSAEIHGERIAEELNGKIESLEEELIKKKREVQSLNDRLRNAKVPPKKKRHYHKRTLSREEMSSGSLQGSLGRSNIKYVDEWGNREN